MQTGFSFKFSRYLTQLAIFLIPFYFFRFSIGPLKTNIFEVAVFLAFASCICLCVIASPMFFEGRGNLFDRLLRRKDTPRNDREKIPAKFTFGSLWPYLFLLIAFISIFIAPDKTAALGIFKGWFVVPVVLYWLIINLFGCHSCESRNLKIPDQVRDDKTKAVLSLVWPLFAAATVIAVWGMLQGFGLITTLFYQKGDPSFAQYLGPSNFRLFGPFESPNYLAMFLVPVIFLVLPLLYVFQKKSRSFYLFAVILFSLMLSTLMFTGSRAGLIAFFVPFILILLVKVRILFKQNSPKRWLAAVATSAVILMSLLYYTGAASGRAESNSSRLQIYHYALEIGRAHPVSGIGLGGFQTKITEVSINDADFVKNTLSYALHPHSIYLAMWLNLGILGLIIFLILIVNFFRQLWPQRKDIVVTCLITAMLAILIHGLFDTTYFKNDLSAIFWLIIAVGEIIHRSVIPAEAGI